MVLAAEGLVLGVHPHVGNKLILGIERVGTAAAILKKRNIMVRRR